MSNLNVSICFVKEWWDKYFHSSFPRPMIPSDDALDEMYLKRKRFLFEQFGLFGIGEETPVMDGKYVSLVIKYGQDIIPYLMGAKHICQEAGGYKTIEWSKDRLKSIKPVDIANHPLGEWLLQEKEHKLKRYGKVGAFLEYGSCTNLAFRLYGMDFYIDLIDDPVFIRHVLSCCNESMKYFVKFVRENFPPTDLFIVFDYMIGNCNVVMISPEMYTDIIKPFDVDFAIYANDLSGGSANLLLHHCDVNADHFLDTYSSVPHVSGFQASHITDIVLQAKKMPGVDYYAMIGPTELNNLDLPELEKLLERAIRLGARELDLWCIDTLTTPDKLRSIFDIIVKESKRYGRDVEFNVLPFVWDELEWAFPQYQPYLAQI